MKFRLIKRAGTKKEALRHDIAKFIPGALREQAAQRYGLNSVMRSRMRRALEEIALIKSIKMSHLSLKWGETTLKQIMLDIQVAEKCLLGALSRLEEKKDAVP